MQQRRVRLTPFHFPPQESSVSVLAFLFRDHHHGGASDWPHSHYSFPCPGSLLLVCKQCQSLRWQRRVRVTPSTFPLCFRPYLLVRRSPLWGRFRWLLYGPFIHYQASLSLVCKGKV